MYYVVKSGDSLSKIAQAHNLSLQQILELNPRYVENPNSLQVGAQIDVTLSNGIDYFKVKRGQLTFDAEGSESRGRYFSRLPHVPSGSSGVTIGRGYDCKMRTVVGIYHDLILCEIPKTQAELMARSATLAGDDARAYIEQYLSQVEITPRQQWLLFDLVYSEIEADVLRICTKTDVLRVYGATDWAGLDQHIRDVVIDWRYRGDYTPATRKRIQPILVNADTAAFKQLVGDRDYWLGQIKVPQDRFLRRVAHVKILT